MQAKVKRNIQILRISSNQKPMYISFFKERYDDENEV